MMARRKRISNTELLKTGLGTPLAVGTMAFVGGKLPSSMGSTVTGAVAPSVGMAGMVTKVSFLGMGMNTMREAFKMPKTRQKRHRSLI